MDYKLGQVDHVHLCYFPLGVVLVDDNEGYLCEANKHLHDLPLSTYSTSTEAMGQLVPVTVQIKDFLDEQLAGTQYLNYDYIKQFVEDSAGKHGVLIVDWILPDADGMKVFSQLADHAIRKILLTGERGHTVAIQGLNERLIHNYLEKGDYAEFRVVVGKQEDIFFKNITEQVLPFLDCDVVKRLTDASFIEIFATICQEHEISKYYILNSYAHYYLENKTEKFVLSIYHKDDLADIASSMNATEQDDVSSGNFIPSHFPNGHGYTLVAAKRFGDYSYALEKYEHVADSAS